MFLWNTATSTLPGGPFLNHFLLKNAQRLSEGHRLYQWSDYAQIAGYELALRGQGYSAGDSDGLVPIQEGGIVVSHILTRLAGYEVRLWPADDPMTPSNLPGKGLIWYSVTRMKRKPPKTIPVTEVVRVYEGERVRIRTWEPRFQLQLELHTEIQPLIVATAVVGVATIGTAIAMQMTVSTVARGTI